MAAADEKMRDGSPEIAASSKHARRGHEVKRGQTSRLGSGEAETMKREPLVT